MAALGSILSLGGTIVDAVFHTKADRDKFIDGNVELRKIEAEIETTLVASMSMCWSGPIDGCLGFGSHPMMPMPSAAGRKNWKQLVLDTATQGHYRPRPNL